MLTYHAYHVQPDTLAQIRECQTLSQSQRLQRGFISSSATPISEVNPNIVAPSPERIRRSFHYHRTNNTTSSSPGAPIRSSPSTPTPLSLRHRIRSQAQSARLQSQIQSSTPNRRVNSTSSGGPRNTEQNRSQDNHPATFLPYPILSIDTSALSSLIMSRPTSSSARPTHIPLPNNNFTPTGTPLATPPIGAAASPASPRHSFLGFIRTRGRANTLTNVNQPPASPSIDRTAPPTAPASRGGSSREGSTGPMSREPTNANGTVGGNTVTRSISTPLSGGGLNISTNTNGNGNSTNGAPTITPQSSSNPATTSPATSSGTNVTGKTFRIRLVPHLESTRSLAFDPVVRELLPIAVPVGVLPSIAAQSVSTAGPLVNGRPPALILKVGRFTDKASAPPPGSQPQTGNSAGSATVGPNGRNGGAIVPGPTLTIAGGGGDLNSGKVAFKSKVVSRSHAEIWCEQGGQFFIRDTSSSSGTFLNHIRLSSPNTDSRPTMLKDGDVLQLGVDYQGGVEEMFRCVKIRVEIGREWQRGANEFNTNALKQLKELGGVPESKKSDSTPSKKGKASVTDCCICLFSVTVCQSLFIAPCSHVFHYKCIRPLLLKHHPGFSCPLCRTFANLEEDVETEDAWEIASRRASIISRRPSNHSIRLPTSSQNDAGPSLSPAAPVGQPSTNIGLGGESSASINVLLTDIIANPEQESESAEGMIGSSALARQTTAVGQESNASGGDTEMEVPEIVEEESESETGSNLISREGVPVPISSLALNDENGNGHENGYNEAATPMNEHFLSTLAIGDTSGIAQRFELADELANTPTTASSLGFEHGNGNGNEDRNGMYT